MRKHLRVSVGHGVSNVDFILRVVEAAVERELVVGPLLVAVHLVDLCVVWRHLVLHVEAALVPAPPCRLPGFLAPEGGSHPVVEKAVALGEVHDIDPYAALMVERNNHSKVKPL